METKVRRTINKLTVLAVGASGLIGGAAGSFLTQQALQDTMVSQTAVVESVSATATVSESLADVVSRILSSVVEINTVSQGTSQSPFRRSETSYGAGSGVIVTEDGYIVTNYHVIEGSDEITVRLTSGDEYTATVVSEDANNDLALLKIDEQGLVYATFEDSDSLRVGQTTIAIGNPLGTLGGTVTEGILSATNREITIDNETMNLLQTSAAINSGNSGGGLFDEAGNLIGIVNAKSSGLSIEGLGFAIPSNTVREFLTKTVSVSVVETSASDS